MALGLLDTKVVPELRRSPPDGALVAWLQSVDDADLHLASVTIGEIQAGIEFSREQDPAKAAKIAHMDGPAIRCWAQLMHRQSEILYEDEMIAAMPKVHHHTVVRRNVADFSRFEVTLLRPSQAPRRPPTRLLRQAG